MKQKFNNIVFLILIIASLLIGFALPKVFVALKFYGIYISITIFVISTLIYNAILNKKDKK